MNLDLTARRVVVASMLYYGLDVSMMPDSDFDAACVRLSKEWDQLDEVRKWQLGSAEEIHSTGNHVKVTSAAAHAAIHWLGANGDNRRVQRLREWRNPRPNRSPFCRFLLPGDFRFTP